MRSSAIQNAISFKITDTRASAVNAACTCNARPSPVKCCTHVAARYNLYTHTRRPDRLIIRRAAKCPVMHTLRVMHNNNIYMYRTDVTRLRFFASGRVYIRRGFSSRIAAASTRHYIYTTHIYVHTHIYIYIYV